MNWQKIILFGIEMRINNAYITSVCRLLQTYFSVQVEFLRVNLSYTDDFMFV